MRTGITVLQLAIALISLSPACSPGAIDVPGPGPGLPGGDALTLTAVSPDSWSNRGGIPITLRGRGFTPGTTVRFGGTAAAPTTFVSAAQLLATLPAQPGLFGRVPVQILAADGRQVQRDNLFSYSASQLAFENPVYLVGQNPAAVAAGDVNGD